MKEPKTEPKPKRIRVDLDPDVVDAVDREIQTTGRTFSQIMNRVLRAALKKEGFIK